jgi:hypothetical protein
MNLPQNIPKTIPELEEWSRNYEDQYMKFAQSNQDIAEGTVKLFLSDYPKFMHPLVRRAIYALMEGSEKILA